MNLILESSRKSGRWVLPPAGPWIMLILLGCAASTEKSSLPKEPTGSFAETRARIGLLTDEHVLNNDDRYRSFARIANQDGMEVVEALMLSVDDSREVPPPPDSSGSETVGTETKWTVGYLCKIMLFRILRAEPNGKFEKMERDWHAWWEANRARSLAEIRTEIAAVDDPDGKRAGGNRR